MKTGKLLLWAGGVGVLVFGGWSLRRSDTPAEAGFRTGAVTREDLRSTVSATGALSALRTVEVGTQVSGQVSEIHVDYNDRVKKGQLLARIDPTLSEQAVQEAEAGMARAEAELKAAQLTNDRTDTLFQNRFATAADAEAARAALDVAKANLTSAKVALERARRNLGYTDITSPIDGVVIERSVDVGQTVAASLQAPQLFLIANDLSAMQILATVDESDVGKVHPGQAVRFTVQAWPEEAFRGVVRQLRLKDSTVNNVVSYVAVVDVRNPDGRLLPGMTATTEFVTDSAPGALTVPNAALRFRPAGAPAPRADATTRELWVLGQDGHPSAVPIAVGISDGRRTVVSGEGLREGMQVILGAATGTTGAAATTSSSPFGTTQQGNRPPGPPTAF